MTKTIQNLINKYGADELHLMIDAEVARQQDNNKLKEIMSTHLKAKQWFTKFAKDHPLTVTQVSAQHKQNKNGKR